ncbi:toprim domain-containing protein [Spirosoma sp. BT702]|uniref:Toprim domain-containing protein n=1 Tax=Spirosoma profusum TaxID=2771354 RepID=A0A926Y4D1_9BACT|nr:toprim domain-containing protein [Spirosoma profusum]MBD2704433.1 toprim domain-containing protein [Spirosoma profusum]
MATYEELGIEIRGNSKQQKVKCPTCSHTRKNKTDKSLSVNLDKGTYHCFNCGWKGVVDGKTAEEKKQEGREYYRQQREYAKPNVTHVPLADRTVKFFEDRKITRETLQYFKVTESQEWMPEKDGHKAGKRTCINFNYYRGDDLVNIKYRDPLKCFKMTKDAELILYNLNSLKGRTEMLICEGEIDAMAFYQSGYYGATSVPNGASKGSAKLEYLDNCAGEFDVMFKIIIATDGDEPGRALRDELVRRLGSHRCWLVEYPEGCKDANEVLIKHGNDAVRKLWSTATAPPIEDVLTFEDLEPDMDDVYQNGWPKIEPIGYEGFDALLNFGPGQVTTVTGIPQHGKDEFIRQIMIRKAVRYGEKSFIFNPEEEAWVQATKAVQQLVGKTFYRHDRHNSVNPAQYDYAKKYLNAHLFFVDHINADLTIDGLLVKCAEMVLRKGVKYISLGPYNCIEDKREQWQTEGEYVSQIYQKLTRFALKYKVHIFFVAHTTKMLKEGKKFVVPNLYNISGSANFFNKTHNGITCYRNYEENTTDIWVQKVKYFFYGKLGMQSFHFDVGVGRFTELGTPFTSDLDYLIYGQPGRMTSTLFPDEEPRQPDPPTEQQQPPTDEASTDTYDGYDPELGF